MNEKLNIGIIGCGTISAVHAKALKKSKNGEIVSAYSRNKENLTKITNEFSIDGYTELDEFLDDPNINAVSICTPSGTHLDYAEKAAEAGKHVIIEKPIEVSLERAKKIIEVCKSNNVRLAVIYQNRFIDDVVKMKQTIEEGKLGKIFMADAYIKWYRSQEYYNSAEWRGTLELDGGGVLINQAIHTIDLLLWLAGDVEHIYAKVGTFTHSDIEGEDNAVATLKFANGALGVIEGSTSVVPAFKRKIEIHGENGTAVLEGDSFKLLRTEEELSQDKVETKNSGGSNPLAGFSVEPHKLQFEQIINAIINNEKTVVSGEDSLKSLGVVKAIYESSEQNKTIKLKDFINN